MAPEAVPMGLFKDLPDDMINRIMSLLPFRSAFRTKILSSKWKERWYLQSYELRECAVDDAIDALKAFLNGVEAGNRQPAKWGIKFKFNGGNNMLFATASDDGILHFDFSQGEQEFPGEFAWTICINPAVPSFHIRSLYLVSVDHRVTGFMNSIIPHLPFLDSLTLVKCNGLRYLTVIDNSRLRKLTILDCLLLKSLWVDVPYLRSFLYRGMLPLFSPGIHRFLPEAMLDIRRGPGYSTARYYTEFSSLLENISCCTTLTMCRWLFEDMFARNLCRVFGFGFLRELWWIDCSSELKDAHILFAFLRLCPNLERLFLTVDQTSYRAPTINQIADFSTCKPNNLRIVRMEGFANQRDEILLAIQLGMKFGVVPTVMAPTADSKTVRLMMKIPRIHWWKPHAYYFRTEAKDKVQFSSDHPHMAV